MLEAADARYLEDTECCMRVAMGELGDDIQEAVMADCSILEVAGDVVSVIGGVPRAAEATFEAGPLLDGGGGKAPGGALVKRQVGRWGQSVRHHKGLAAVSDGFQSNNAKRVVKGIVEGGELLWLQGHVDVVNVGEGHCFGASNRAEPPDDGGQGDAKKGRAERATLSDPPLGEDYPGGAAGAILVVEQLSGSVQVQQLVDGDEGMQARVGSEGGHDGLTEDGVEALRASTEATARWGSSSKMAWAASWTISAPPR